MEIPQPRFKKGDVAYKVFFLEHGMQAFKQHVKDCEYTIEICKGVPTIKEESIYIMEASGCVNKSSSSAYYTKQQVINLLEQRIKRESSQLERLLKEEDANTKD